MSRITTATMRISTSEDGEPPGELLLERQDDEGRREQKFVCDGIEIRAEGGSLIQTAREQTVNSIGKTGDNKNQKRPAVMIVGDENEKKRQKAEAQKRNLIGYRPNAACHCDKG